MLDQIDIPFLRSLRAEWRQAPPLRFIAAAFAGYKPPREAVAMPMGASKPGEISITALKAAFPNGRL